MSSLSHRILSVFSLLILLPTVTFAQSQSIEFNVNMSYQIELGDFNPSDDFVDVAGSFNDWGSELTRMADADNDSIYSVTVDGFSVGEQIAYKFRLNGEWGGTEEFPGAGNDRYYTVIDGENVIEVWYNDEAPPNDTLGIEIVSAAKVKQHHYLFYQLAITGQADSVYWSFEGGEPDTSTLAEPVIYYREPGTYQTKVIATNEFGLSDTAEVTITVEEYQTPTGDKWWTQATFYEIFVRSFYDSDGDGIGDFNGITEKLDYLNDGDPETTDDLGIDAIWLMPIHPSPSYHAYDVTDYKDVNPDYGTMDDFKNMLAEAHKRGIKIIIDYVINHSSDRHPWFIQSASGDEHFRDFYVWEDSNPGFQGPWGQGVWHQRNGDYYYGVFYSGMPDLNYENPAVKDSILSITDFWLDDVGIDGFRIDAIKYLYEEEIDGSMKLENTPKTFDYIETLMTHIKSKHPDAYVIGETWSNTVSTKPYVEGTRLDQVFTFDLANSILGSVRSGDKSTFESQFNRIYNTFEPREMANFLTNHDQNRIFDVLNNNLEQAELAASIYLTLPGTPYLYYGEEIAMTGSKPDPDIRLPMPWSDAAYGGFSSRAPWRTLPDGYRERNVETMQQSDTNILKTYQKLNHLREQYPLLTDGRFLQLDTGDESVLSYMRTDGETELIFVANLSNQSKEISITHYNPDLEIGTFTYKELLNGGKMELEHTIQAIDNLQLSAHQSVLLTSDERISLNNKTESHYHDYPDEVTLRGNYPNPFNPSTNIAFSLPQRQNVELSVFNLLGQKVATLYKGELSGGEHTLNFNAQGLSSGVYLYRLRTSTKVLDGKMILMK